MATEEKTLQTWDLPVDCGEGKKIQFKLTQTEEKEDEPEPEPKLGAVKKLLIFTLGITLLIVILLKGYPLLNHVVNYYYAESSYARGEYEHAKEIYEKLGTYKDSAEKGILCIYKTAEAYEKNQKYEKAQELFSQISYYKDAKDKAWLCNYGIAQQKYDAGEYDVAKQIYLNMGDYKNCAKKAMACDYAKAENAYQAGDYQEAKGIYESLGNFKDCNEKVKLCIQGLGTEAMEKQDYAKALIYLQSGKENEEIQGMIQECNYNLGMEALGKKKYSDALAYLREALDYPGAKEQYTELNWKYAYARLLQNLQEELKVSENSEVGRNLCIALDYIDSDDVPELMVSYTNPDYEDKVRVYTLQGDLAVQLLDKNGDPMEFGANGTIQYQKKQGEILDSELQKGFSQLNIYAISGNIAERIYSLVQGRNFLVDGVKTNCMVQGKAVGDREYQKVFAQEIQCKEWISQDCSEVIPKKYDSFYEAIEVAEQCMKK